jgi:hypothetical protein
MEEPHERRQEQSGKSIQLGGRKRIYRKDEAGMIACSEAAHKAKDAVAGNDSDFDRLVELGSLVECLGGMCAPHLMLLHEIAEALDDVHETEGEQEKRSRRHH